MYGATAEKSKREGIEDRDQRLEARYTYDRLGEASTLAFVAVYSHELAKEFLDWFRVKRQTGESQHDGFARWEVGRFGAELDKAPHQALWWRVRWMVNGGNSGAHRPHPRLTPGLDSAERHRKLMAAIEQTVIDHGFPATGRALPAKIDRPYEERLVEIFSPRATTEREPGSEG